MRRIRLLLGGVLAAAMVAAGAPGSMAGGRVPAGAPADGIVWTDAGPVRGTVTGRYRLFQGIPYAAPPKGALRWAPPRPVRPWSKIRDATTPPRCLTCSPTRSSWPRSPPSRGSCRT